MDYVIFESSLTLICAPHFSNQASPIPTLEAMNQVSANTHDDEGSHHTEQQLSPARAELMGFLMTGAGRGPRCRIVADISCVEPLCGTHPVEVCCRYSRCVDSGTMSPPAPAPDRRWLVCYFPAAWLGHVCQGLATGVLGPSQVSSIIIMVSLSPVPTL